MQATDHLAKLASDRGLLFVDAPVLGTRQPAEKGELVILASAREEVREHCEVVFRAVGKKTLWLEEGGKASRLKLVANAWILALLTGLAESITLAYRLGLDPRDFLQAIDGGPVGPAYANIKGTAMIDEQFPVAFPLRHALKDVELILTAAEDAHIDLPLAQVARERLVRAAEMGYADEDMAAVVQAWSG